ncbi:phosphoglycolate phosphatase [Oceaniferula spumae]|uniref:phosphoglycolate phosphatase n=1 Tax=Oceaniferula spumae TaxID=2979115 RepID=A0AAT9FJ23_9BACT
MHSKDINWILRRVIRAVIFDLDGTLVHSLPGIAASLNRVLAKSEMPTHTESVVRGFIGDGMRVLVQRALTAENSDVDLDAMVDSLKEDYANTWTTGTAPYPDVTEVLHALLERGTGVAVLSNKPHIYCREITDKLFPRVPFTAVIGQRDGIPAKPDPSGAIAVAKELNIPVSEIAFLGDSTIDLLTARNAGMIPIAATWGYHDPPALAAENPTHSIHSISDLLPIIEASI